MLVKSRFIQTYWNFAFFTYIVNYRIPKWHILYLLPNPAKPAVIKGHRETSKDSGLSVDPLRLYENSMRKYETKPRTASQLWPRHQHNNSGFHSYKKLFSYQNYQDCQSQFKKKKKVTTAYVITQPLCLLTLTLMLMLTKTQLKVLTAVEEASVAQMRPKASARVGKMM